MAHQTKIILSLYHGITIPKFTIHHSSSWSVRGHADNSALTNVARGIAKKTPQNPQNPPKTNIATIIATGCKLTASENNKGTSTLPSRAWIAK
ncbi:hypothetical protein BGP_1416 [Beggiatoa sp. PS]|nr:hypothetical protein BGP_1416 [Beggiatoa sp. PS]